ncbi:MAG TPA: ECF-type sigma factor [Candidatus Polarisedimenticolia bacterium]|jgi:RNA polymerase sigma factor (TIGR02999 family)
MGKLMPPSPGAAVPEPKLRETVTESLEPLGRAGSVLVDELLPLVYDELRAMAHRQLAGERRVVTLDTTGLVHEAYLRLVDETRVPQGNRAYFFGAAARAMRRVLVDAARRRNRLKRGGGVEPLDLDGIQVEADKFTAEILDLEEALENLARLYPRQARVVECRFFGGLDVEETAAALDLAPRTVKRDWALARAWLYRALLTGRSAIE